MLSKILNIFELLVLLLIIFGIKTHYDPFVSRSFFYYNAFTRVLLDLILGSAILIRVTDLVVNFNLHNHSYKKLYLPLILYSIAIIPDMYFYILWLLFVKHLFPPMFIFLLPILIIIGRITFTKRQLKIETYSEDILDAN